MSRAAEELILRLVGGRLDARRCLHCGARLSAARLELVERTPDAMRVSAVCECGQGVELRVEPEADGGAAQLAR